MADAYIVEALRTAGGRRGGALREWHPADLGAAILDALVGRSGIDPAAIEDVIVGCVSQVGEQSFHIGRNMVMASDLPDSVPAVSIDRQCGSSQQALHFAAQAVMSGTQDIVIAAGVESMTRVPMGTPVILPMQAGMGIGPWPKSIKGRYGVDQFSQFTGAEMMAQIYGFGREELDQFALGSHRKAAAAADSGAFKREIVILDGLDKEGNFRHHDRDEGIRAGANLEGLAELKTIAPDGMITAGNASQVCDGASGVLVVSERALKEHGLLHLRQTAGRTGASGLAQGNRCRPQPAQCQWRGDRPRPSVGSERGQADGDTGPRAACSRKALWTSNHVRGRRHRQCYDHRGAVARPDQ